MAAKKSCSACTPPAEAPIAQTGMCCSDSDLLLGRLRSWRSSFRLRHELHGEKRHAPRRDRFKAAERGNHVGAAVGSPIFSTTTLSFPKCAVISSVPPSASM